MSDEEFEFAQMMGDVKPIEQDRVVLKPQQDATSLDYTRDRAVNEAVLEDPLSSSQFKEIGPDDVVSFKRTGLQDGVYRKLRLGKYTVDARLDLHQHTVEQARKAVFQFIQDCLKYEVRSVIIQSGKGARNSDYSIVKSHLVSWLEEMDAVLGFHTAQKHHGGTGAFYVLLKKSEQAKQRNREQHGLR